MGTQEDEALGYPDGALDRWAKRARVRSSGGAPDDLDAVARAASVQAREVFVYVIAGFKARNPAAATALIDRLA